jgi:hypothetical protein
MLAINFVFFQHPTNQYCENEMLCLLKEMNLKINH